MKAVKSRWDAIRQILQTEQRVAVGDLAHRLDVSEVTIRKDLVLMEGQGLLLRTYGGAILAEDSPAVIGYTEKSRQALKEKDAIARKALALVENGQNILLDSGTTCLGLAHLLRGYEVQVITNSLLAARVLAGSDSVSMVILGGTYRPVTAAIIGDSAVEQLRKYNIDTAFMGASGATPEGGFSCQNMLESQLKRAMWQQAARRVILMDSGKFGTNKFAAFAAYGDIHVVVTDDAIGEHQRQALLAKDIEVL